MATTAQETLDALVKVHRAAEALEKARKAHNAADAERDRLWKVWVETSGRGELDAYQKAIAATGAARENENKALGELARAIGAFLEALGRYAAEVFPPPPKAAH